MRTKCCRASTGSSRSWAACLQRPTKARRCGSTCASTWPSSSSGSTAVTRSPVRCSSSARCPPASSAPRRRGDHRARAAEADGSLRWIDGPLLGLLGRQSLHLVKGQLHPSELLRGHSVPTLQIESLVPRIHRTNSLLTRAEESSDQTRIQPLNVPLDEEATTCRASDQGGLPPLWDRAVPQYLRHRPLVSARRVRTPDPHPHGRRVPTTASPQRRRSQRNRRQRGAGDSDIPKLNPHFFGSTLRFDKS